MQVVRSKYEEFYEALTAGKSLRAIFDWLSDLRDDQALERLRRWMQAEGIP